MHERRASIRIAGNTMIPALHALRVKGYALSVWYTLGDDGGLVPQYDAEKDGRAFSATSPEELLGLVAMWEVRGDDWQLKSGEAELYDRLIEAAPVYDAEGNAIDA
jgi:hypothetical protein